MLNEFGFNFRDCVQKLRMGQFGKIHRLQSGDFGPDFWNYVRLKISPHSGGRFSQMPCLCAPQSQRGLIFQAHIDKRATKHGHHMPWSVLRQIIRHSETPTCVVKTATRGPEPRHQVK